MKVKTDKETVIVGSKDFVLWFHTLNAAQKPLMAICRPPNYLIEPAQLVDDWAETT